MTRYYTLHHTRPPKAYDDDWAWETDAPKVAATTVHEAEDKHVFSGVYNAAGEPMYRSAMKPIGFLAEWDD